MKETKLEVCRRISSLGKAVRLNNLATIRKEQEELYYQNPKNCLKCNTILYFDQRKQKFCGSKCSGSYNTRGRVLSDELKKKISIATKKSFFGKSNPNKGLKIVTKSCSIYYFECVYCHKIFIRSSQKRNFGRRTCSDECMKRAPHNRTYLNGSRKTIYYLTEDKGVVVLESTWEEKTAELLDSLKIKWIRPDPIQWIDSKNKKHLYFPDFYLLDYNMYLDPKNPYCMKKDEEKMNEISKKYKIIYGDISIVKQYIVSLVNKI